IGIFFLDTVSRNKRSRPWKSERPLTPRQDDWLPEQRKTRPIPLDQYLKRRRTHDESKKVPAPRSLSPVPRTPSPIPRTPSPIPRTPSPIPRTPSSIPRTPIPVPRTPSPVRRTPSPAPVEKPSTPRTPWPVPVCGTPKNRRPLTPRVVLSPSDYVENIPPKSVRSLMTQTVPTLCDFGTQTDPILIPKPATPTPLILKRDAFTQTKKRGGQARNSPYYLYTPRRM
ncbi:PREDICTED: proline-rich receptor-like protein kinase PERK2, partial [Vollenhovia emeryi]|uniref:proline-rich receptor-like protein kinase PERK2 n=1 Tax=Vollenhovia emeryi TaxID=411798 RepID=UPI0005F3A407